MSKPKQQIIDRAFKIYADDSGAANGEQYRPSNGTEGEIFMAGWCEQCWHDRNEDCPILAESLCGEAKEWQYWNGKPLCTKFRPRAKASKPQQVRRDRTVEGQITLF